MNMIKKWVIKIARKWQEEMKDETVYGITEGNKKWAPRSAGAQRRRISNGTDSEENSASVAHNYDDSSVITFKVYGANGGKIVETSRYHDKYDNARVKLYIIDENLDFAESLAKIVTMEYLQ
jgi:hypothetical protein